MKSENENTVANGSGDPGESKPRAKTLAVFPQFRVENVRTTSEWYRDFLGFEIGEYFLEPPVFVHIRRDYIVFQIGLAHEQAAITRTATGLGCNAYIWTDNIDTLAEDYRSRGVKILEGPVNRQYACREILIEDCNGLRLCFAQRI